MNIVELVIYRTLQTVAKSMLHWMRRTIFALLQPGEPRSRWRWKNILILRFRYVVLSSLLGADCLLGVSRKVFGLMVPHCWRRIIMVTIAPMFRCPRSLKGPGISETLLVVVDSWMCISRWRVIMVTIAPMSHGPGSLKVPEKYVTLTKIRFDFCKGYSLHSISGIHLRISIVNVSRSPTYLKPRRLGNWELRVTVRITDSRSHYHHLANMITAVESCKLFNAFLVIETSLHFIKNYIQIKSYVGTHYAG